MHSRLFLVAFPMALTLGAILHAFPGGNRAEARLKLAPEARPQPRAPCPNGRQVVEIRGSADLNIRNQHRLALKTAVETDCTTVVLGPDVDLDFTGLPDKFFPLSFGKQVTLTSVSAFTDNTTGGATTIRRDRARRVPAPRNVTTNIAQITEARTPRSLGPVLRFGKHGQADTFLQVLCSPDGAVHDGARISGFRLYGPSFGQQSTDTFGISIERCVDIDISNMEIAGWGGAGVEIVDDPGRDQRPDTNGPGGRISEPSQVRVHDNFFHHNQHPNIDGHANGYGVEVNHGAWALISQNVFDFNRHAISAAGDSGGYEAKRNLVLKGGGYHGEWYSTYTHIFDVHGTGCWWSSNLCGLAGIEFKFLDNAFQYRKNYDIKLRGTPICQSFFDGNVFPYSDLGDALNFDKNVVIGSANVTGFDSFGKYGVGDFDGDGVDDLFLATGATWWVSSFGEFHWSYFNAKKERLDEVRLGYFDNDLRCDVLAEQNGQWVISSGGTSDWRPLGAFGVPLSEVQFGRFDPSDRDHRPGATRRTTHAFRRAPDGQWYVTPLSSPNWKPVQSSSFPMSQLRFGDFNGDGVTDVLSVNNGRWAISESATSPWQKLNASLGDAVGPLFIANMDRDDNIDDILRLERQIQPTQTNGLPGGRVTLTWWRSRNGVEPWRRWKSYVFEYTNSPEFVPPLLGFVGRFGADLGGGTLVIDANRLGHFYSEAEIAAGASPDWTSLFAY